MKYFPDTCVFVRASYRQEKYYEKAHKLIIKNKDNWSTSTIVHEELCEINNRRREIYKNILSLLRTFPWNGKIITKNTLWKQYFKSVIKKTWKRTENDEIHIQRLFDYCIDKTGLVNKSNFNEKDIKNKEINSESF